MPRGPAREDLDIRNQSRGARRGRLRPGVARTQAKYAILEPPPIVEHDGDLPARISTIRRRRHPIRAFRGEELEPILKEKLVQKPRLLLDQSAEQVAFLRVRNSSLFRLPFGKVL